MKKLGPKQGLYKALVPFAAGRKLRAALYEYHFLQGQNTTPAAVTTMLSMSPRVTSPSKLLHHQREILQQGCWCSHCLGITARPLHPKEHQFMVVISYEMTSSTAAAPKSLSAFPPAPRSPIQTLHHSLASCMTHVLCTHTSQRLTPSADPAQLCTLL